MNRFTAILWVAVLGLALTGPGCMPYRIATAEYIPRGADGKLTSAEQVRKQALEHWLYRVIPRKAEQLYPFDARWITWAMLGNEQDGIFGEDNDSPYSDRINFATFLKWGLRNPGHNCAYYVIGSRYLPEHRSFTVLEKSADRTIGLSCEGQPRVFARGDHGFILAFNDWKPFISCKFPVSDHKMFDAYWGWRPGGEFGMKFRPAVDKRKD